MSARPEGTNRLTIDLPRELHRQLKVVAAEQEVSMRDLIEQWLRRALEQERSSTPPGQ